MLMGDAFQEDGEASLAQVLFLQLHRWSLIKMACVVTINVLPRYPDGDSWERIVEATGTHLLAGGGMLLRLLEKATV